MENMESYQDQMVRLFPEEANEPIQFNGKAMKCITFQVTENCNLRCSYCYQHEKRNNRMTFDIAKRFIDMLLASDERTNQYITADKVQGVVLDFIGGEPFLEIELIDQICDYFLQKCLELHHHWATRFRISMSTNGTLYFEPKVQAFIKKWNDFLSLGVTIDGNKKLHDACRLDSEGKPTYDRAMAAVLDYRKNFNPIPGSKMTIAPGNVNFVYEALISMIENGYKQINANCVYEEGWTVDHAKILYDQCKQIADYLIDKNLVDDIYISLLDKDMCGRPLTEDDNQNWCGGTGLMLGVDWKGDIYPCLRYMDNSICGKQPPYIIGNVYDGIMQTPEEIERVKCLECITRRSQSTDECWNCPIAMGCAWCSGYNYEVFGTPNKRATFICEMHKARVLATSYLWNKWYNDKMVAERYPLYIPQEWAENIIPHEEYLYLKKLSKE